MIHTYGDSHSGGNWGIKEGLQHNYYESRLAYSVGRDQPLLVKPEHNIQPGDAVLWCFGEIDCRNHIHRHKSAENPPELMIGNIVDAYFTAIDMNVKDLRGCPVIVVSVTPPAYIVDPTKYTGYPREGTNDDRKHYAELFNRFIRKNCEERGYIYLDLYSRYVNEKGFINTQYSFDGVHITDPIFVREELSKLGFLQ